MLIEVMLDESGEAGGILAFPEMPVFAPGQYFLGCQSGEIEPIARTFFPAARPGRRVWIPSPLPVAWQIGARLSVSGPFGNGFHLPPVARKVALASFDGSSGRLQGLLQNALEQHADVTLYLDQMPSDLPAVVEVQPFRQVRDALDWAEYIALDIPFCNLGSLRDLLRINPGSRFPCPVEVLVHGSFPCGGTAECGVCAVKTRRGYKLACKDGPVFKLEDLELG